MSTSKQLLLQIFRVEACTRSAKELHHDDLFEVGGKAFKWKLNKGIYST